MDRIAEQIETLEEWRCQLLKTLRKATGWLALALILLVIGGVWSLWRIDNLVDANAKNIGRQDQADKLLADEQFQSNLLRWNACVDRNDILKQQLRQDKEQLLRLVKAHLADGSKNAAKVWKDYLEQGQKTKLPECGPKPVRPPTPPIGGRT